MLLFHFLQKEFVCAGPLKNTTQKHKPKRKFQEQQSPAIALFGKRTSSPLKKAHENFFRKCSVEKIFLGRNADSAFKLGHARGVALSLAGQHQLEVGEYATRHVKKMLTGSGAATKEQVQFMIEQLLQTKVKELDATDALALAVCHARKAEVAMMFANQKTVAAKNIKRVPQKESEI